MIDHTLPQDGIDLTTVVVIGIVGIVRCQSVSCTNTVKWKNNFNSIYKRSTKKGTIQHHINRNKRIVMRGHEKYFFNTTLFRLTSIIQFRN